MPDGTPEVPANEPQGIVDKYLTWSTDKALDAGSKTPAEHGEEAKQQAMLALAELKARVESDGLPKKGFNPVSEEGENHETAAIQAGFKAIEALIKAGQSGTVDIMGGVYAYDPVKGAVWKPVAELRKPSEEK
jgi:hypothetical protein